MIEALIGLAIVISGCLGAEYFYVWRDERKKKKAMLSKKPVTSKTCAGLYERKLAAKANMMEVAGRCAAMSQEADLKYRDASAALKRAEEELAG